MRIAVIGGDLRMLSVCRLLKAAGCDCVLWGFESPDLAVSDLKCERDIGAALAGADAAILPLPYSKGGKLYAPFSGERAEAEAVFSLCREKCFVLGGGIGKRDNCFDYSLSEPLLIKNAKITAEGALSIAMNELKTTVFGSRVLITGFGRIAKFLGEMCAALGASVSVVARKSEALAFAESMGFNAVSFGNIGSLLPDADILFNTVPAPVINRQELLQLDKKCRLVELASLPGGIDRTSARSLGFQTVEALGLPGKYAPKAAGDAIFRAILPILQERGLMP